MKLFTLNTLKKFTSPSAFSPVFCAFLALALTGCEFATVVNGGATAGTNLPDTSAPELVLQEQLIAGGMRYTPTCEAGCQMREWVQQDLGPGAWTEWSDAAAVEFTATDLTHAGPYHFKFQARDAAGNESDEQTRDAYLKPEHLIASTTAPTLIDLPTIAARRGRTVKDMLTFDAEQIIPTSFVESDRELFTTYNPNGVSPRPDNWLKQIGGISGIAWNNITSGTLITRQHFVMAGHFQRGVGETMVFHDANGQPVSRTIVATAAVPGGISVDIAVGKLNEPVPDNVQVYPLISGSAPPIPADITNLPYVITDQNRRVYVHLTVGNYGSRFFYGTNNPALPAFMAKSFVGGDSGHPAFIILAGNLLLMSTHTYASYGNGPYYGEPQNQIDIQTILNSL